MVGIAWNCNESSKKLLDDAISAFDAAALARIEELCSSPVQLEPSCEDVFAEASTVGSGFDFALRSLSAVARYASRGVAEHLVHFRDRHEKLSTAVTEQERAVHESSVSIVFCEAMLTTLNSSRFAYEDNFFLDSLQERALKIFRYDAAKDAIRMQTARRRLVVLQGRTEEALWIDLNRILCRYRYAQQKGKVEDDLRVRICSSLQGMQLQGVQLQRGSLKCVMKKMPLTEDQACRVRRETAGTFETTCSFLEGIASILETKKKRDLHRPVAEALGSAL